MYFFQNFYERRIKSAAVKHRFNLIFPGNLLIFTATFMVSLLAGNQFAGFNNPTAEPEILTMMTEEKNSQADGDSLLREILSEQQAMQETPIESDESQDGQRLL